MNVNKNFVRSIETKLFQKVINENQAILLLCIQEENHDNTHMRTNILYRSCNIEVASESASQIDYLEDHILFW